MTTRNLHLRFAVRSRFAVVMLVLSACAGHAPTRRAVAPSVRDHVGAPRDEAEAKRDLAKNKRDTLSASEAGYYLDVLQGRLLQALGAEARLSRTTDRIGIDLTHRVRFDGNSPRLTPAGCQTLQPLTRALIEFRKTLIVVKSVIDGAGQEAKMLAERRSRAVADCLASSGVAPRRIVIVATKSTETALDANAEGDKLELDIKLVLRPAKSD
jgi:outer membrane protein OmpA-like peptidoglycan-associated protein